MQAINNSINHFIGVIILYSSTSESRGGIPSRYIALLAPLLALSWLIPNHQFPWTTFHSDIWMGLILAIVAIWVLIRTSGKINLPNLSLLFFGVACIPWLQHFGGMIYFGGVAWIQSLYLVGFALVILIGRQWQNDAPEQPLNFLFTAFVIGGLISVAIIYLQLIQYPSIWINPLAFGRANSNLNQPNQLATLLLLALLGITWWYQKGKLGAIATLMLAFVLVSGLSLTLSRTGWLNMAIVGFALIAFPPQRPARNWRLAIVGLMSYFALATLIAPEIIATYSGTPSEARNFSDNARIAIWLGSIEAIIERPWLGWGWGQTYTAFYNGSYMASAGVPKHSHNIVLDLLLYNGIPLGVTIIGAFLISVMHKIRQSVPAGLMPILALSVFLVHAMLELPLHHAYFLLPFGLLLGALSTTTSRFSLPKSIAILLPAALLAALWITAKDYLKIEQNFNQAGYASNFTTPYDPTPMSVLTQWGARQWFINSKPTPPRDEEELKLIENIEATTPQLIVELKLAHHLALGGRMERASFWMNHMCQMGDPTVVKLLLEHWDKQRENDPLLPDIAKPRCDSVLSEHPVQTTPSNPSAAPAPMNHSG